MARRLIHLRCDEVHELLAATNNRLTISRFVDNVTASIGFNSPRIPDDPLQARRELCG